MDGKLLHSPLLLLTLLIYMGSADFPAGKDMPGDNRPSSTPIGLPRTLSSSNVPFLFGPLTSTAPSGTNATSYAKSSPPSSARSSASLLTDPGISSRSWLANSTTSKTKFFINFAVTEKQLVLSSLQAKRSQATPTFSTESSLAASTFSTDSSQADSTFSTDSSQADSTFSTDSSQADSTFSTDSSQADSTFSTDSSQADSTFSTDSSQADSTFSTDSPEENSTSPTAAPSATSVSSTSSYVSSLPYFNDLVVSSENTSVSPTESSQSISSSSTKSLPMSSVVTSRSSPKTCGPAPETLVGLKGSVQWTGDLDTDCKEPHTWEWQVPADHGVVVHIQLIRNCIAQLYQLVSSDGQNKMKVAYAWPMYIFPIVTVRGNVMMKAEATAKGQSPSLKLSYEVYPVSKLPRKIDIKSQIASSYVMFNCSTNSSVPEAFACDGVKHCIGDEDEKDCEYRNKGCGDWLPYGKHCLKLDVMLSFSSTGNAIPVTLHVKAKEECRRKYGATLAALPDNSGKRLVASMMYQGGVRSVPVNLRKTNPVSKKQRHLYRYTWQWGTKGSPIAYKETDIQKNGITKDCAVMLNSPKVHFEAIRCFIHDLNSFSDGYVCMKPNPDWTDTSPSQARGVHLTEVTQKVPQVSTKRCADGSVVQMFHQCRWQGQELSTQWSPNNFPLFQCQYGPPVHYTVVCDGLQDCADGSDEAGCLFPNIIKNDHRLFLCESRQVITKSRRCDGVANCFDGSDEEECTTCQESKCTGAGCVPWGYVKFFPPQVSCTYLPPDNVKPDDSVLFAISAVHQDGFGMSGLKEIFRFDPKLIAYFRCANDMYIPTYLLNNGELDCLGGEDEHIPAQNFTCPGFYRCQLYGNCVHPDFVCDGVEHCPNKDDERYCGLSHPSDCTCEGYACSCHAAMPGPLADFAYLRYLDLSRVKTPSLDDLFMLNFLRFLNASFCQLSNTTLKNMPQLEILDLSYNVLWEISSIVIQNMTGLTHLNLSGNPLVTKLDATFSSFLEHAGLLGMKHLVMKYTRVQEIGDNAFSALHNLDTLDLRGNKLKNFGKGIFAGLVSLDLLQADDPRLCCSYFHPKQLQCNAPLDELSSCNDLLRSDFFRALLWALSFSTILGNIAVFLHKVITMKKMKPRPYQIFVSHLCVADFLMGVYMATVGAADMYFRGNYVANERRWKQGGACFAAGFLAFISSEVSALMICLITLDRLLILCFPFKPQLHMTAKFSMALCCVVWALGLLLAAGPFMGQLEFYGESSICLPLPITRHQFSGQTYAFVVFIVLNFLLFLFIGTGQLAIYWAVHRAREAVKSPLQEEQTSIARRLFLVVFTDFCCWFPVGLMGILASAGVPIPGVVSVWAAVIVLPLNSALNPFLYTLNGLRERWNIRKINRKSKRILCNLKGEIPKLAPSTVEEMMMIYLRSNKSVKLDKVSHFLKSQHEGRNNASCTGKTLVLPDENTSETWVSSSE